MSPALAGGFSTTAPPGKPLTFILNGFVYSLKWLGSDFHNHLSFLKKLGFFIVCKARLFSFFPRDRKKSKKKKLRNYCTLCARDLIESLITTLGSILLISILQKRKEAGWG